MHGGRAHAHRRQGEGDPERGDPRGPPRSAADQELPVLAVRVPVRGLFQELGLRGAVHENGQILREALHVLCERDENHRLQSVAGVVLEFDAHLHGQLIWSVHPVR